MTTTLLVALPVLISAFGATATEPSGPQLPPITVQAMPAPVAPPEDRSTPLPTPEIRPKSAEPKGGEPAPKRAPDAPTPKKDAMPGPKAAPPAPGVPPKAATPKTPAEPKGLAVLQPRTPKEREKALSDLYAMLATAEDEQKAKSLTRSIERLWLTSGSDTVNLLMHRAMEAANGKKIDLALKLLDAAVDLAPDYAEAWNRRAYVHFISNNYELALGDLRRVLALDGNHYKALDGLMNILREIGKKKEALAVGRQLLDVNPFHDGIKSTVEQLAREVEGRGI
ncbi:MAG TPA: tetratricopeptide repeat protein [Hyphomicrobiaceae bacterium]|nr:tetratricopeptide repeat protein [Hyphomicrobiaceae bacterium]